jgi:hypothetical protein
VRVKISDSRQAPSLLLLLGSQPGAGMKIQNFLFYTLTIAGVALANDVTVYNSVTTEDECESLRDSKMRADCLAEVQQGKRYAYTEKVNNRSGSASLSSSSHPNQSAVDCDDRWSIPKKTIMDTTVTYSISGGDTNKTVSYSPRWNPEGVERSLESLAFSTRVLLILQLVGVGAVALAFLNFAN